MVNVNQPATGGSKIGMWVALIIAVIVLGVGAYFLFARENNTNTTVNNLSIPNGNANAVANANTNETNNENLNVETNINTNVDTSGWRTYENTKFAYSFKYPAGWLPLDAPDGSLPTADDSSAGFGSSDDTHIEFRVSVESYPCDSLEVCVNTYPHPNSDTKSSPEIVEVDSQEALYQNIDRGTWIDDVWYLYPYSNYTIVYSISASQDYPVAKPIIDAIISTVDFK